ncbi:MAG: class I SAM-dependent RNA methyltransferase [Proteobacteria bacterium]|jgi:23S rRNA (uracil1939-C5)-methyltransferase|nr:methyltransferase [Alphaproteobacteria bacterium]NCC03270.1 class I SAM-dependent RNA methyltransferase [Pseudomonadota bacterium]
MTILELKIDDIGAQGDGIAHHGNATIFVGGTLTGERVRINLDDSKNVVKRAELLDVLIASSWRVTPPCPHFGKCGGCRFQHMNDEAYSNFKLEQLQITFAKAGLDVPCFLPAVTTATATRRRARITAHHTAKGILIGFNEWRSHAIIDVQECPILKSSLVDLIRKLRVVLPLWLNVGQRCDIQMTILPSGIDLVLIGGPALGLSQRQALAEIAQRLNIAHLSWKKLDRSPAEPIVHQSPLSITFGNTSVNFPPGGFLQASETGEAALIEFTKNAYNPGDKVLDLYCGLGTFGLSMPNPEKVHFVDLDGPAIGALGHEIKRNGRYEVSLRNLNGDPCTAVECNDYTFVIFDPPRGGAQAQAKQLAQSDVPRIVAISCDPESFARDAKILIEGGYCLESILPVDQFLWSPHLECAAKFTKKVVV